MTMVEERISKLEGAYEQVDARLGDIRTDMNARFADVNARFDDVNAQLDALRTDMNSLRSDMNTKFNILFMVIGTAGVAIAGSLVAMALRI